MFEQVDYVAYTALINAYAKRSDASGALKWLREMSDAWLKVVGTKGDKKKRAQLGKPASDR